jgi:hypothetical protein
MALTYTVGDTAVETALFKVGGVLTDPTTVTATVVSPSGVSSNPSPGHQSVGTYTVSADLIEAGDWFGRIVGTGAAKGAKEWYWTVRRSEVPGSNLIAEALVTVADMRFFLDRVTQNVDMDETRWLEDLINEVSLACARYIPGGGRQLTPERTGPGTRWPLKSDPIATGVSKTFRYDGSGYLNLSPFEVRNVTAVVMGSDLPTSQQVTLAIGDASTEAEFRLEPASKTVLATYLWIALPIAAMSRISWASVPGLTQGGRQVKITGDWGPPPGLIPADIQRACKISVGQDFRNPEQYASRAGPGEQIDEPVAPEGPGALHPASMKLLSAYRRA